MKLKMALLPACFVVVALYSHQTGSGLGPASPAQRPAMRLTDIGGATPLYFIANEGQMSAKALYYARTPGYTLWLTREGLVFERIEKTAKGEAARSFSTMTFLGANKNIEIAAGDPTDYRVSYFYGRDESEWKTGISTSKAVLYKNVYDGIDLKVYGTEKQVEYDWIVAPGADPGLIRFAYVGEQEAKRDADGNLVVRTAASQILQRKPVSHQVIDGRKVNVESTFRSLSDGSFGFSLGAYDPRFPLTIDPLVLAYGTFLGGHDIDDRTEIAVDGQKAIYLRGVTISGDFPPSGGAPRRDIFVTKLSSDGSTLVYTAFFPFAQSSPFLNGGLFVDSKGFAYLSGTTYSNSFPLKNPFQDKYRGKDDGFILKLSKDGRSLVYSSYIGGGGYDYGMCVAVDAKGAAYVGGYTDSRDFPTKKAFQKTFAGATDAFVAKVAPEGSTLVFATYLGGTRADRCQGLAPDASGAVVVAGSTSSSNFPKKSAIQTKLADDSDGFLTKLTAAGNGLVYSTYLGGNGHDSIDAVALDAKGDAYITGFATGSFPLKTPFQKENRGGTDAFIAKISANGRTILYSSLLGGSSNEYANSIAVDKAGVAYVAGLTQSRDFPLKSPYQASRNGTDDAFLAAVEPNGSRTRFATFLGGRYKETAYGIAVDAGVSIYVSGTTNSPDFPVRSAYQDSLAGQMDVFVAKFTQGNTGRRE